MTSSQAAHAVVSQVSEHSEIEPRVAERHPLKSDIRELSPSTSRSGTPAPTASRSGAALTTALNKFLVGAYKLAGFSLLSIILFGLASYIGLNALFFLHKSWMAPAIISPSDPRVLQLRTRLAQELWNRQKVEADRSQVRSQLNHARRTIAMEEQYQETFHAAVAKNASFQYGKLAKFKSLQTEIDSIQQSLETATGRFAEAQGNSVQSAFDAKLINQEQKATADYRLAELEARQVAVQGQKASLVAQMAELTQKLQGLSTVASNPSESAPATLEGLELKRSFMNSVLETQRAQDESGALKASEVALAESLKGYDEVISIIRQSPLVLAATGELTVAFVPYDNLPNIKPGAPVFGCSLYVIWCRKVGQVGAVVEGEVVAKHPVYGSELRGKFVRLNLDNHRWAEQTVLHVGRPPLWL